MNKILAIAAVLITAFNMSAHAEINPTSLNDADKERIVKIWPEKTSGVYKFQHWIKLNDAIYSIPTAHYRKQCNSRKTCKAYFIEQIQGQITAGIEASQAYFDKATLMHTELVASGISAAAADIIVKNTYPDVKIVGDKLQLDADQISFEADLIPETSDADFEAATDAASPVDDEGLGPLSCVVGC